MSKQAKAPGNTANAEEEELPQTAVKPRSKDLAIMSLQEKLAAYIDKEDVQDAKLEPEKEALLSPPSVEEDTFKKRYGDLRRHTQQKEEQAKREISNLASKIEQLTAASNQVMPKTKEEFEEWKAKYPDIATFIEMIADEKASQRTARLQEELGSVKETLVVTEKDKARAILKAQVPEYEELYTSKDFIVWLKEQPKAMTETVEVSDDPYDVAKVFKAFKNSQAKPEIQKKPKDAKLDALDTSIKNTGPSPSNSRAWKFTQSQISKMTTSEYEKAEPQIIEARNEGLILDDMSKRNTVFDI